MTQTAQDWLGPLDYLIVEVGDQAQAGFDALLALVDAGKILILDFEVIRKSTAGIVRIDPGDVEELDLAAFSGAESGLLDQADLNAAGAGLAVGAAAVVVVYEVLILDPVIRAWADHDVRLLGEGPITGEQLEAALGESESEGDR